MQRILVVEDDSDLQYLYDMFLVRQGYDVTSARSATQALLHLTNSSFDLIILDMNMPDTPGIRVLEFTQNDSRLKQIPVLVISANDQYRRAVQDLGARDFFTKPVPMQRLASVVNEMLHTNGA